MDTYGDLVTLLLTFFVMLFAMSTIDADRWRAFAGAFRGSPIVITPPMEGMAASTPIPVFVNPITGEIQVLETTMDNEDESEGEYMEALLGLYENISDMIEEEDIRGRVILIDDEYTIRLILDDTVLFNSGQSTLLPEALTVLEVVARMIYSAGDVITDVSIEGHTDSVPISTARYLSNWELGMHRAMSVHRYFRGTGIIDMYRTSATSLGEYRPIATNETPEGRQQNRRVEFVFQTARPDWRNVQQQQQ